MQKLLTLFGRRKALACGIVLLAVVVTWRVSAWRTPSPRPSWINSIAGYAYTAETRLRRMQEDEIPLDEYNQRVRAAAVANDKTTLGVVVWTEELEQVFFRMLAAQQYPANCQKEKIFVAHELSAILGTTSALAGFLMQLSLGFRLGRTTVTGRAPFLQPNFTRDYYGMTRPEYDKDYNGRYPAHSTNLSKRNHRPVRKHKGVHYFTTKSPFMCGNSNCNPYEGSYYVDQYFEVSGCSQSLPDSDLVSGDEVPIQPIKPIDGIARDNTSSLRQTYLHSNGAEWEERASNYNYLISGPRRGLDFVWSQSIWDKVKTTMLKDDPTKPALWLQSQNKKANMLDWQRQQLLCVLLLKWTWAAPQANVMKAAQRTIKQYKGFKLPMVVVHIRRGDKHVEDTYYLKHKKWRPARSYIEKVADVQTKHKFKFKTIYVMSDSDEALQKATIASQELLGSDVLVAHHEDPYILQYAMYGNAPHDLPLLMRNKAYAEFVAAMYIACRYAEFVVGYYTSYVTRMLRTCIQARVRVIPNFESEPLVSSGWRDNGPNGWHAGKNPFAPFKL